VIEQTFQHGDVIDIFTLVDADRDRQPIQLNQTPHHPSRLWMSLPQELIEEILSYLRSRDKRDQQSLRNCSLVAKSWINPSRRRLFKTVVIRKRDRQSWLDKISPSNTELLRHLRSLCFSGSGPWELAPFTRFTEDLYVYFPSLRRLRTIGLSGAHISSDIPERIEMFPSRGARS